MPWLGNTQVVASPHVDNCVEQGCPSSPERLYRISAGPDNFYQAGLCKFHSHIINRIPAGYVYEEISADEWLVGEVMGS